jgi:RNA polymerase sigma-70 factor (ECF subfamily)
MAAGTALEAVTMATAEDAAAQEFARVVEKHRPQIFRFLLASTRDVDLAETLTQECFLKAHRNWANFRGESSAMTWLMRIAINLQKDHWRNRRMQFWRTTRTNAVDLDEASEWLPSGESSVEQQLLAKERVKQVWRSVEGLSERQRTVFLLRYVEEQDLSEIAAATGLSEGTVKAHLSRAVSRVRLELGGKRS